MSEDENKDESISAVKTIRGAAAGLSAGLFIACISFPAEGAKKWFQTPPDLRLKYRPYRGLPVFASNIGPTTLLQFGFNAFSNQLSLENNSYVSKFAMDFTAGVTGALSATAVEGCIAHQQFFKNSLIGTFREMFRQNILRPWRSYSLIAVRDGIFATWMFGVSIYIKETLEPDHGKTVAQTAAVGSGIPGALISHPCDTVASRAQQIASFQGRGIDSYESFVREVGLPSYNKREAVQKAIREIEPLLSSRKSTPSLLTIGKHMIKTSGIKSLWAGASARCVLFPMYMVVLPYVSGKVENFLENNF